MTILGPGQSTPAPWINVIANAAFGFQTATEGGGYTWSGNSRENQLTPWSNDPVSDPPGEAFYLRDEETGEVWSPTALPIRDAAGDLCRPSRSGLQPLRAHGARRSPPISLQFVPLEGSIKISRLRADQHIRPRPRRSASPPMSNGCSAPSRSASLAFVETEIDAETGAMFARNPWNTAFGSRVAFADMRGAQTDWTGDRREFIGRNGTLANPAALASAAALSNKVGAGSRSLRARCAPRSSCRPAASAEIVFFLGDAATREEARATDPDAIAPPISTPSKPRSRAFWDETLGAIEVKTPDRAMDIMLNGWLLYQTLACRVWARSAFYQASGAYGFRDQLQDGMALAAARPDLTREHLLRAAARQFVEGDVQHWWLPHSGQGVRTRISDDRAWLAYAVAQYVEATGDTLRARRSHSLPRRRRCWRPDETDNFFLPTVSETQRDAVRALRARAGSTASRSAGTACR